MTTLSERGMQLLKAARINFALIDEHGKKVSASEQLALYATMIAHIRSACPQALITAPVEEVSRG